ncbi:hypothetical protein [Desulfosporosinus acididurans]|uniref:hypothetical protein n=1 Tax=Desulfosporosinus acididurans TaxID=476652 RepID=UPI000B31A6EB|nr:hypothetical protein [Desulfosporosinus acididurans]
MEGERIKTALREIKNDEKQFGAIVGSGFLFIHLPNRMSLQPTSTTATCQAKV